MRRTILLIYALIFVTESLQAALVPLLPRFAHEFGLSDVETGSLLSAATLATVVIGVPIGLLSDRLGAKTLAVGAAFIVGTAAIMQAFAPNYGALFAGRLLFGIGFGTAWTAGVVVVSQSLERPPGRRARRDRDRGGFAHFIVPVVAGNMAESAGIAAPSSRSAPLRSPSAPSWRSPPAASRSQTAAIPRGSAPRRAGERRMEGALLLMAVLGIMAGAVPLLVPLQLDRNGLSASEIGTLFSLASGLWVAASFFVARLGDRAAAVRTAGLGVVALAAVVLVPLATAATAALAAFLSSGRPSSRPSRRSAIRSPSRAAGVPASAAAPPSGSRTSSGERRRSRPRWSQARWPV